TGEDTPGGRPALCGLLARSRSPSRSRSRFLAVAPLVGQPGGRYGRLRPGREPRQRRFQEEWAMSVSEPRPVLAWMEMLGRIRGGLGESLGPVPEDEAAAGSEAAPEEAPLRRRDERLARLQARLDQAERDAAAADALLAAEADALKRWSDSMAVAHQRLVEQAAPR